MEGWMDPCGQSQHGTEILPLLLSNPSCSELVTLLTQTSWVAVNDSFYLF